MLIDVVSDAVSALDWKQGTSDVIQAAPVRDSVMAIADASYFDWPVLPEAPSGLSTAASGGGVVLQWELHGGDAAKVAIERRVGNGGKWERIATDSNVVRVGR